jgi:DNA polymerase-1
LRLEDKNNEAVSGIFIEFEFNSLGKRILGKEFVAGRGYDSNENDDDSGEVSLKNIESVDHDYSHIVYDDEAQRRSEIDKLIEVDSFCFDTETTGTDPIHDELLGMAISCAEGKALYFECPRDEVQRKNFIKDFTKLFSNPKTEKI